MKQLLQNLKTGEVTLAELPAPQAMPGKLLVRTAKSLVSLGTERMLLEFGKAGWIGKARQQPDKVKQVIQKIKTDGLEPTVKAVFRKLDQPLPLGYSNAGVVLAVGDGVRDFQPGDRVATNGPHAELALVPVHLAAKVPDEVGDLTASFTVVSSIALHGVRLLEPTLGERVAVVGLGLIGLLTVQILRANGCRVIGFDFDARKVALARSFGAQAHDLSLGADAVAAAMAFSDGEGIDGVLITAATPSNDPIEQAPRMCRKRGRVVLVGVAGLTLNRTEFFKSEVSFRVSCSYGPGRYDDDYEQKGVDYPVGYVRWTEQRNFQAVLELMAAGAIRVDELVSEVIPFYEAPALYARNPAGALGLVFDYPDSPGAERGRVDYRRAPRAARGRPTIGVIGAGAYASSVLVPALARTRARLVGVADADGASADHLARKFRFAHATTDSAALLADPAIECVVITTRHDSHAALSVAALEAGKHVFVEKPLAMSREQLGAIEAAEREAGDRQLMVGFNRRFSPLTEKMKELLAPRSAPACLVMTVNAGAIPREHWAQDPLVGGGRIIGEACHFIDLLAYLAGAPIERVAAFRVGGAEDGVTEDKTTIQLAFADGSVGTVHYFANGPKDLPKERLEVFFERKALQLDNFKRLRGYGFADFSKLALPSQDKGQRVQMARFVEGLAKGERLIPFAQLRNVTLASFAAVEAARDGAVISLGSGGPS